MSGLCCLAPSQIASGGRDPPVSDLFSGMPRELRRDLQGQPDAAFRFDLFDEGFQAGADDSWFVKVCYGASFFKLLLQLMRNSN